MKSLTLLLLALGASGAVAKTRHARRPASINAQTFPDYRTHALLRRFAPFNVDEKGRVVRINKDGTFSREGASDEVADGKWKIFDKKIKLRWNSGEEREYAVGFAKGRPVIAGTRADKRGTFEIKAKQ